MPPSRKADTDVPKQAEDPAFDRKDALRLLVWVVTVVAVYLLPLGAFLIGRWTVSGQAKVGYFEQVSQILPILLLALVIEQKFLTPRLRPNGAAPLLGDASGLIRWLSIFARFYAVVVLVYLAWGEIDALSATANGAGSTGEYRTTVGALAAGFVALIVTALFGAGLSEGRRNGVAASD